MVDHLGDTHWTIAVWTSGSVEIQFQHLAREHAYASHHPFLSEEKRLELLQRLNDIPDVSLPPTSITKRPNIPLSTLFAPEARRRFLDTLDWLVAELRTGSSRTD